MIATLFCPFAWTAEMSSDESAEVDRSESCLVPESPTPFNAAAFLAQAGLGKKIVRFRKGAKIFSQGDIGSSIFYIQQGKARLTVISEIGKQVTLAILNAGDFVGQECLPAGHQLHIASATALTESVMLRIGRNEMIRVLHDEQIMSEFFVAYLLERTSRIQDDLIDQLFNSTEKRLARALLNMANFGKLNEPETNVPKISQEALASIIGCTRSRVNLFMNRFRKAGYIEYNGDIKVNRSLLNVLLHDADPAIRERSAVKPQKAHEISPKPKKTRK
jgi:CRP/FNR family transcriptional regulator, cyclic AMP receptor protein